MLTETPLARVRKDMPREGNGAPLWSYQETRKHARPGLNHAFVTDLSSKSFLRHIATCNHLNLIQDPEFLPKIMEEVWRLRALAIAGA